MTDRETLLDDRRNDFQKERLDPGTLDCECGNRVTLIPHKDYMGERWAGCDTRNLCKECPLHNVDNLLSKIKEIFGND